MGELECFQGKGNFYSSIIAIAINLKIYPMCTQNPVAKPIRAYHNKYFGTQKHGD